MKKQISNSINKENDPQFEVIRPVCKACENYILRGRCKVYEHIPNEYLYAEKYDCPEKNIDKDDINYKYIKDKLNN